MARRAFDRSQPLLSPTGRRGATPLPAFRRLRISRIDPGLPATIGQPQRICYNSHMNAEPEDPNDPTDGTDGAAGKPSEGAQPGTPRDAHSEELLVRFADGDDSALGELIEREAPRILRRVDARLPRQLKRRVGASDILQLTAVDLLSVRKRFRNQGVPAFRNMVLTIANLNVAKTIEREGAQKRDVRREKAKRHNATESQGDTVDRVIGSRQQTPSEILQQKEKADALKNCFAALKPADQEVIQLIDYEEVGYEAVASRLGISREAARQRHHRAIQNLRNLMKDAEG